MIVDLLVKDVIVSFQMVEKHGGHKKYCLYRTTLGSSTLDADIGNDIVIPLSSLTYFICTHTSFY